ncbi:MAG: RnfABCDGE type electron transport complex subunit D [Candidatus Cloacimonetes bacterium]|nr:RnfABCDGE type electron transport complex subunit D [Candidatus Cloacimonadota bacterium]
MLKQIESIENRIKNVRANLGAKWSFLILLTPLTITSIVTHGVLAFNLIFTAILVCMVSSIMLRKLSNQDFHLFNPGSIITGLLIALTCGPNLPLYMIILGAFFGEVIGKYPVNHLAKNIINPAILGRTLIALFETFIPYQTNNQQGSDFVDLVSGASILFKDSGGILRPELYEALVFRRTGALGECSSLIILITAFFLLRYLIIKREACINFILWVPLFVLLIPSSTSIVGHAPWVSNPALFLLGSSTLLTAVFFATDPKTIPKTKIGGTIFGIGAAFISVFGRVHTSIPGFEMFAVLIMNLLTPFIDELVINRSHFQDKDWIQMFFKIQSYFTNVFPQAIPSVNGATSNFIINQKSYFKKRSFNTSLLNHGTCPSFRKYSISSLEEIYKRSCLMTDMEIIELLKQTAHTGRGGAHFSVHKKWETALNQKNPPVLIVNASEGEPSTFKDKYILKMYPHILLFGIHICAKALNIKDVIIVMEEDFTLGSSRLKEALKNQFFLDHPLNIEIKASSNTYLGGEETALLEHLEGKLPIPRIKPPFPFQVGLNGKETLIHNAETLTWLPMIIDLQQKPNFLVSLSGDVDQAGVYEVKVGDTIQDIIDRGFTLPNSKPYKAFELGGPSGVILPAKMSNIAILSDEFKKLGLNFSSGAIRVISKESCLIYEVYKSIQFFEKESCGKCSPCRLGTKELSHLWRKLTLGIIENNEMISLKESAKMISSASMCGLGKSAANQIHSLMQFSNNQINDHINKEDCEVCSHEYN